MFLHHTRVVLSFSVPIFRMRCLRICTDRITNIGIGSEYIFQFAMYKLAQTVTTCFRVGCYWTIDDLFLFCSFARYRNILVNVNIFLLQRGVLKYNIPSVFTISNIFFVCLRKTPFNCTRFSSSYVVNSNLICFWRVCYFI